MTEIDSPAAAQALPPPRPWGYFSTLGWVVLAHILGSIAGLGVVYLWNPDSLETMADFNASLKDGWLFSLSTVAAAPVMIGILFVLVRLKGWSLQDFLAFTWPGRREVVIALIALAVALPSLDLVAYVAGHPVVTQFQIDLYESARRSGALLLLWIALVVAAPVWEEIAFRGFIYRGWIRTAQHALPGVLLIAALFAILHVQYNWFGILQVFALGLLFGWARWRSGSTLLAIVMHAITNFYSTVQTVVVLKWLS